MAITTTQQLRYIVEPILATEFDGVYDQRKDEWSAVFKEEQGTPRAYHEEVVMHGFGAAPEMGEGAPVTYQSGGVLYVSRYLYKNYGLAFALTKNLIEDGEHIKVGKMFSRHLAQSVIETKETVTANVLNRSLNSSYKGGDGVELVSSAHPLANGGTASNLLNTSAALSQTSLEQMLIQIRNAVDSNGKRIKLEGKKLVVPTSLMFTAEVILKSTLRTGTANNDVNALNSMSMLPGGTAVISRLTSSTAWWVQTDASEGLKVLMRRKMDRSMEGDFETDSVKYKATERYATGWTDWRTVFGTSGV